MGKVKERKTEEFSLKTAGIAVNRKEREALQTAMKLLNDQSERLGLLDPLEAEPAILFFAEEGKDEPR